MQFPKFCNKSDASPFYSHPPVKAIVLGPKGGLEAFIERFYCVVFMAIYYLN